ncbi:MAG: hypothetical protein WBP56_03770 [Polyangia bacterium]
MVQQPRHNPPGSVDCWIGPHLGKRRLSVRYDVPLNQVNGRLHRRTLDGAPNGLLGLRTLNAVEQTGDPHGRANRFARPVRHVAQVPAQPQTRLEACRESKPNLGSLFGKGQPDRTPPFVRLGVQQPTHAALVLLSSRFRHRWRVRQTPPDDAWRQGIEKPREKTPPAKPWLVGQFSQYIWLDR